MKSKTKLIYRGGWKVHSMFTDKQPTTVEKESIAQIILSRDYKGLRNHDANVIVEVYEVTDEDR